ncbi:flavodoxin family protein [Propionispora vibrioides]|uniref:NADPH-dependent FMN reductase n=1 Tax=Propionispora vibrioides TaxID=112903 RepID=A0A1H8WKR1_9FIRM|nr:NADPH-dependent FMN reductase [Propionispora vibrioides]
MGYAVAKVRACVKSNRIQHGLFCLKRFFRVKSTDDLVKVFAAIDEADGVIVGSPVYFGRFTAQLALLMDHLYAYIKPDGSFRYRPGVSGAIVRNARWSRQSGR